MKRVLIPAISALLLFAMIAFLAAPAVQSEPQDEDLAAPTYGQKFWAHWGDGRAEMAGYDLEFVRYGQKRKGTATTIFVTETFSNSVRVKADAGRHPRADTFPVMKLNLIQDFPTGVYDYNMMESSFIALTAVNGRSAGTPTKVSFSSQEWCGHVYHQLLFDRAKIRYISHSYFDGEADGVGKLDYPKNGFDEESMLHWARGFAAPMLAPGQKKKVKLLRSLQRVLLRHIPLVWENAELDRARGTTEVRVPAGTFKCETRHLRVEDGRSWTFHTEQAFPHRLIEWRSSDGHRAQLLGSERMKYWQLNGEGGQAALKKMGLKARALRRP